MQCNVLSAANVSASDNPDQILRNAQVRCALINTTVIQWRIQGEGHGAMPPFGPTMKIFYRRLYMKRCGFAIFQQELQNSTMFDGLLHFQISEKWANLRFPLNIQKQKVFQL